MQMNPCGTTSCFPNFTSVTSFPPSSSSSLHPPRLRLPPRPHLRPRPAPPLLHYPQLLSPHYPPPPLLLLLLPPPPPPPLLHSPPHILPSPPPPLPHRHRHRHRFHHYYYYFP